MEFILSRFRNLTILLVVILAQLVLLAYQVKSNQDVRMIRVWSVTAVTPIAKVLEFVRRYTIGFVEDYIVLVQVRSQNRQLAEDIGKLKLENQYLRNELSTAGRAEALTKFQTRIPSKTIAARIIGSGTGPDSRVVFVDQGSPKGILRGMAVITPDGIVGKVLAAYPTASQVLLITDPAFAAGVVSQNNGVHGTLKGLGQSKCLVNYVQNEEKVDIGEMFYTSGDDRVFPRGMPVGRVSSARAGSPFQEIYVTPSGLQSGFEEVLIVIEDVHQPIPDLQSEAPAQDLYLAPPLPAAGGKNAQPATSAGDSSVLNTTADKVRERYKKIGEVEHHTYGEGAPGSKPPDFNIDPDAKPAAALPAPGKPAPKPAPPPVSAP